MGIALLLLMLCSPFFFSCIPNNGGNPTPTCYRDSLVVHYDTLLHRFDTTTIRVAVSCNDTIPNFTNCDSVSYDTTIVVPRYVYFCDSSTLHNDTMDCTYILTGHDTTTYTFYRMVCH